MVRVVVGQGFYCIGNDGGGCAYNAIHLSVFQIAAISPADINFEESLSTLKYGISMFALINNMSTVHLDKRNTLINPDFSNTEHPPLSLIATLINHTHEEKGHRSMTLCCDIRFTKCTRQNNDISNDHYRATVSRPSSEGESDA